MAKQPIPQAIKPQETPRHTNIWLVIGIVLASIFLLGIILIVILIASFAFMGSQESQPIGSGNVALLRIDDVIVTQSSSASLFSEEQGVSSEKLVKRLHDIRDDDTIQAVAFEINSPGGSGVASDEIAQAIRELNKPTVSYVREVGASGAYWIASSTDHIIANRMSIVGSIGVIASYLDFSGFIKRYNVSYQRFVAGDTKDFGTPFRTPTKAESDRFQQQLDAMHTIFIEQVALGRELDVSYVRSLADGGIFTGQEALDAKLIDELGGKDQAQAYLEKRLGRSIEFVEYADTPSFLEALAGASSGFAHSIGTGIGDSFIKAGAQPMTITT